MRLWPCLYTEREEFGTYYNVASTRVGKPYGLADLVIPTLQINQSTTQIIDPRKQIESILNLESIGQSIQYGIAAILRPGWVSSIPNRIEHSSILKSKKKHIWFSTNKENILFYKTHKLHNCSIIRKIKVEM